MTMRWRNPIHTLPFAEPIANTLAEEYAALPWRRRVQALRKATLRELGLLLNGQGRRRVDRVPAEARSILWIHSGLTVGEAIMDLAPRHLVPRSVEIDLLIAPTLAMLFSSDRRLRAVHTDPNAVPDDVDFVLLDTFRPSSLRQKANRYPQLPFASMRGHNAGERFDRVAYADLRVRQLFGLPPGEVVAPALDLGEAGGKVFEDVRFRIAVPLGGRVARKRYGHWNEALRRLLTAWPKGLAAPEFRLLGQGSSARKDLATISPELVAKHASVGLDAGDLRDTALDISQCDAFLGVDGGMMHVAVAVGTPGLALFANIDPAYCLRPASTMRALRSDGDVSDLPAEQVADAFLTALPRFVNAGRTGLLF
jgi:hypothetical protein